MSSQYVYASAAAGQTLTAKLYNASMVLQATAASVTEPITTSGVYYCTFTEGSALDGTYRLVLSNAAGLSFATWEVVLTGTDAEVVQAGEYTNSAAPTGGATEAKQDTIIAAITPITTVYNAQPDSECLTLVRGDAYDDTANASLTWTASKNIDAATSFNFTIRNSQDTIVLDQDTTGVTASGSGTTVTVSLTSDATDLLDPDSTNYQFDVEVVFASNSKWTITKGLVEVQKDQSR